MINSKMFKKIRGILCNFSANCNLLSKLLNRKYLIVSHAFQLAQRFPLPKAEGDFISY